MATLTLVSLASKNRNFVTMYFPATCPKGTKSSTGSYYWCPDQLLFRNGQYVRCHLIGSKAATTYGTDDPGKLYNGTIYATTAYQAASVGPLGDVNLETLEATTFYKDDLTATQYAVVESVTGHTHDVQRGTGCKSISFSELNVKGFWHVGTRYFRSGTRTYTAAPQEGYRAVQWTHDIGTVDNNGKLVVDCSVGPLTATADFSPFPTLTYDADGGSPTPETQTAYGEVTIAAAPARQGYAFAGWSIGGETYQPGDAYTLHESATATAQWRKVSSISASADVPSSFSGTPPAIEIAPPADAETGGWTEGARITAAAPAQLLDSQGNVQCTFVSWTASANVELPSPATNPVVEFDMPDSDTTLTANYVLKNLDVRAEVHSASAGKVTASRTLTRGGEIVQGDARYGDVATFTATDIPSGYSFAGWYTEGGAHISSSTTYTTTLVDDLVLYAKVLVRVSFRWTSATPYVSHGPLTLNGQKFLNGEASADLPVGSTVEVKAELEDDGAFTGFTKDDEPVPFTSPSEGVYVAQTTVPNVATEIVAGWAATVESYYVALYAQNGSGSYTSDGAFDLMGENVEEITKSVYESSMSAKHSTTVTARSELGKFYKVTGAQIVRIRAYAMGALPFKRFDWDEWRAASLQSATPLLSSSPNYDNNFSVAGDYVGIGVFKEGATVKVRIRHEDESRVATGSLQLDGAKSYEYAQNGYYAEGEFDEDASVTIMARPANGYKFGGWFEVDSADGVVPTGAEPVSTSALWTFPAPATNKFYVARFEEDSVGILLWEGSDENMEMEWTSKVYVTPKPFDPVAARVDATGYPVSLDVGTMSSPSAEPTRPHPIEVASQDGRRLPRMRPERFVRFTVRASCEIDAVVIGTNMAEVN